VVVYLAIIQGVGLAFNGLAKLHDGKVVTLKQWWCTGVFVGQRPQRATASRSDLGVCIRNHRGAGGVRIQEIPDPCRET
jgi:hypothetical protein